MSHSDEGQSITFPSWVVRTVSTLRALRLGLQRRCSPPPFSNKPHRFPFQAVIRSESTASGMRFVFTGSSFVDARPSSAEMLWRLGQNHPDPSVRVCFWVPHQILFSVLRSSQNLDSPKSRAVSAPGLGACVCGCVRMQVRGHG